MKRHYPLVFSLLLVLVVTLSPGNGKIAGNYLDKVVHFAIFLLLAFQLERQFHLSPHRTMLLLGCVLLGLFTEVAQQYIPGRNMDMYDGIADTLGVVVAHFWFEKQNNK